MKYAFLTAEDQVVIRHNRLRELEAAHFQMSLEEAEEPGKSEVRRSSITDLERRISDYHAWLDVPAKMVGDSPEREDDKLAQP